MRLALIDVSDVTPFVLEEIELCCRCLGWKRCLFIGDSSLSPDAWQKRIGEAFDWLDPTIYHSIRVAIWDALNVGRKAFTESVRAFAAELPAGVAGLKAEALPLAQTGGTPGEGALPWDWLGGVEVLLGMVLGVVAVWVYYLVLFAEGRVMRHAEVLIAVLWQLPLCAIGAAEFCFLVGYLKDCSEWERPAPLRLSRSHSSRA